MSSVQYFNFIHSEKQYSMHVKKMPRPIGVAFLLIFLYYWIPQGKDEVDIDFVGQFCLATVRQRLVLTDILWTDCKCISFLPHTQLTPMSDENPLLPLDILDIDKRFRVVIQYILPSRLEKKLIFTLK
jgi:hypothetical protein